MAHLNVIYLTEKQYSEIVTYVTYFKNYKILSAHTKMKIPLFQTFFFQTQLFFPPSKFSTS